MADFKVTTEMVQAYMATHGCTEAKAREELSNLSPQEQADLASLGGKTEAYGDYFSPKVTKFTADINGEPHKFVSGEYDKANDFTAKAGTFGENPVKFVWDAVTGMFKVGGSLIAANPVSAEDQKAEANAKRQQLVADAKYEAGKAAYDRVFANADATVGTFQNFISSLADDAQGKLPADFDAEKFEQSMAEIKNLIEKAPDGAKRELMSSIAEFAQAKRNGDKEGMNVAQQKVQDFFTTQITNNTLKQVGKDALTALTALGGAFAMASGVGELALAAGGAALLLTSCAGSEDRLDFSSTNNVTIMTNITIDNTNNMSELLELMSNNADKIISLLNAIIDKMKSFGEDAEDIINILKGYGISLSEIANSCGDMQDILKAILVNQGIQQNTLDYIAQNGNDIKDLLKQIIVAIEKLGNDQNANFNAILEQLVQNGAKVDDLAALLKKINENVVKYGETAKQTGQEIIAAIKNLGVNVSADMNAILNAIGNDSQKLDDIKALLQQINGNVVKYGAEGKKLGEKILEAINKLGANMVAGFNAILAKMDKQPNYMPILEKILAKLGDIDNTNKTNFAAILEALGKRNDVDLTALLNKLDEILQAIKDHDVHVTVDVTGKVTCECNCGKGNCPNEGIITELNNILG